MEMAPLVSQDLSASQIGFNLKCNVWTLQPQWSLSGREANPLASSDQVLIDWKSESSFRLNYARLADKHVAQSSRWCFTSSDTVSFDFPIKIDVAKLSRIARRERGLQERDWLFFSVPTLPANQRTKQQRAMHWQFTEYIH